MEYSNEEIKHVIETGIRSLKQTNLVYKRLGEKGLEKVKKNQFGDTCLKIDWECEEEIINYFKKLNLPLRIISEEHGTIDITDNPKFLAVLDGLDGTAEYKKNYKNGRFGTMFGIFSNLEPTYNDSLFGGIMEHLNNFLYFGLNEISFINSYDFPIKTSNCRTLDDKTRIFVDTNFDINKKAFARILDNFRTGFHESSAILYADVAQGSIDLLLECTRKGNLEIASAYRIVKGVGGVIVDLTGADIGNKKYLEFGQKDNLPVITAATPELAEEVVRFLK